MGNNVDSIKGATIGIALLVLLSKFVGFLREMVIAYNFGTGIEYDVFLISVSVPMALFVWFGTSVANLFIPRYAKAVSGETADADLRRLWTDFNASWLAAILAMAAIILFAPQMIRLIGPGIDPQHHPQAVYITRISSIICLFAVLGAFFRSVLNAEKRFLIPAAGPILFNLIVIGSITMYSGLFSTRAILYGIVLGYFAQVVLNFIPFRRLDMLSHFHIRFIRPNMGKFFSTAIIILIIEGVAQLYAIVDRYFASNLSEGVVSALGYSYALIMLPIMIFAYSLSTAVFPYLSDAFVGGSFDKSRSLLSRGIAVSLLLVLPSTIIIWIFSEKLVIVLFQRGAFDALSVEYTSNLLRYFSLGLTGQFLLWIMSRAFYAARKHKILAVQAVAVMAVKIILSVVLIGYFGYVGLAAASSASYTLGAIILLAVCGKRLTPLNTGYILSELSRLIIASLIAGATALAMYNYYIDDLFGFLELILFLVPAVFVTLVVYAGMAYLLGSREIRRFLKRD